MAKIMKIWIIILISVIVPGLAIAQGYFYPPCGHQPGYQNQQPPQPQYINPMLNPVDPRAFEIKTLPPVAPLNPRSSGVMIDPNGQAYYFYGTGR